MYNRVPETVYEQTVKNRLVVEQMHSALQLSSFSLDNETQQIMSLMDQTRDFGYTVIPANFRSSKIQLPAGAVEKYYDTNKHSFVTPEAIKIAYIELSTSSFLDAVELTDSSIESYYKEHIDDFKAPELANVRHILVSVPLAAQAEQDAHARNKINSLLARIKLGEDFSSLAKAESDDLQSAPHGGELGVFGRNEMVPEFEDAAYHRRQQVSLPHLHSQQKQQKIHNFQVATIL